MIKLLIAESYFIDSGVKYNDHSNCCLLFVDAVGVGN